MFLSAYRSERSKETALVRVVNDILHHTDAGSIVVLLRLGISAAFDKINHNLARPTGLGVLAGAGRHFIVSTRIYIDRFGSFTSLPTKSAM